MKTVDRRNFLKVVGAGVGAAAIAVYAPAALLSGAGRMAGGSETAFSFVAEGAVPEGARPTFGSLVLRGHVNAGDQISGFMQQRLVAAYPAKKRALSFSRLGFSGRINRVQNGPTLEVSGAVEDAVAPRYLQARNFHLSIDRGAGTVTYQFQGHSPQLQLKEFTAG